MTARGTIHERHHRRRWLRAVPAASAVGDRRGARRGAGQGARTVASYDEDAPTWGWRPRAGDLGERCTPLPSGSPPPHPRTSRRPTPRSPRGAAARRTASPRTPGPAGGHRQPASACARPAGGARGRRRCPRRSGRRPDEGAGARRRRAPRRRRRHGQVVARPRRRLGEREFLDRWRVPGEARTRAWEERFGEQVAALVGARGRPRSRTPARCGRSDVAISGPHASRHHGGRSSGSGQRHGRQSRGGRRPTGRPTRRSSSPRRSTPSAGPGDRARLDGRRGRRVVFRVTEAKAGHGPGATGRGPGRGGDDSLAYAKYLAWRGVLPRSRPTGPSRRGCRRRLPSAGGLEVRVRRFEGPRTARCTCRRPACPSTGATRRHGPGADGRRAGDGRDVHGRPLAYSPIPPVVFAVVDFEGGGRLPSS